MGRQDERGRLHRHEDGTVHRHFSAGFTTGRQIIPDNDGSEPHRHQTIEAWGSRKADQVSYDTGLVAAVLE